MAVEGGFVAAELPPTPAVVTDRWPAQAHLVERYGRWLVGPGVERGLIGPREAPRLWDRHLLNSVAIEELLPMGSRLVDVGTGAGLPGLALACVRPDLRVDLVESLQRRVTFLDEVVADLGLADRVQVVRGRAEEIATRRVVGGTAFVTARAVAPLDRLAQWTYALLASGGELLAIKGDNAARELTEHAATLARLGFTSRNVVECGHGITDPPVRVIRLRKR
ncbi:MAG: Ribosomal small subunit methyltransferase [Frankiales bacterium]|nr:Ribosomal small subunit methyltransferase [Frankiales bacterium]